MFHSGPSDFLLGSGIVLLTNAQRDRQTSNTDRKSSLLIRSSLIVYESSSVGARSSLAAPVKQSHVSSLLSTQVTRQQSSLLSLIVNPLQTDLPHTSSVCGDAEETAIRWDIEIRYLNLGQVSAKQRPVITAVCSSINSEISAGKYCVRVLRVADELLHRHIWQAVLRSGPSTRDPPLTRSNHPRHSCCSIH